MDLAERISRLENKVALLVSIADCVKYPFICACLDADLETSQIDKILELLSRVQNSLSSVNPIGYSEYERELLEIVPTKKGNADFAKTIIKALNKEDKFLRPADYFKQNGLVL